MTATLVRDPIDRKALEGVLSALDSEMPLPVSEEVLDAMSKFRAALDAEISAKLKEDAKFLLTLRIPEFDHSIRYSLEALHGIQEAAVKLQEVLQGRTTHLLEVTKGSGNPSIKALVDTVVSGYQGAYQFAENVRWTVMNMEAEAEIEAGGGKSFGSVDAALAYLAKQRK